MLDDAEVDAKSRRQREIRQGEASPSRQESPPRLPQHGEHEEQIVSRLVAAEDRDPRQRLKFCRRNPMRTKQGLVGAELLPDLRAQIYCRPLAAPEREGAIVCFVQLASPPHCSTRAINFRSPWLGQRPPEKACQKALALNLLAALDVPCNARIRTALPNRQKLTQILKMWLMRYKRVC